MNTFWDITKRQLEETKAVVRNKDREIEDAEERHQVEIKVGIGIWLTTVVTHSLLKVYKQKVKHLLYEHQNNITELKQEGKGPMSHQDSCV